MKRLLSVLILACCLIPSAASDNPESLPEIDPHLYPSYMLVIETEIPPLDRIDMARRFRGLSDIPSVVPNEIVRQIGDTEMFYITSEDIDGIFPIQTHLLGIGEHVYIWVEDGIVIDDTTMIELTRRFDIEVYEFVRGLWGSEPFPGIDGETRLYIVVTSKLEDETGGYFTVNNSYPVSVAPYSNEHDMMVLSSLIFNADYADVGISGAAHEFQHMIQHNHDANESNWIHEGLATLTEYLLGIYQPLFLLNGYVRAPQTSLVLWGLGNNRVAEYGAPMLFLIYLHDRFGLEAVQAISADTDNGLQSVDNMLQARDEAPVDVIFADWVVANLLREASGIYSYQSLVEIDPMALRAQSLNLPSEVSFELNQYGTDYFQYLNVPDAVTISLQMDDTVKLIPTDAASGNMIWYSQRADNSNMRLTHAFDLRNVSEAQLNFNVWHDLEPDWDYGYISISSDGGQTWTIQDALYTTDSDSNGRAYGEGYTGRSNGWLADRVSLNDYVGQEILLRFELVTDDAINFNGIALDDIRIDAIGYQSDFEDDDGGWVSEGWIRTDNRLPQRAWLQVIEHTAGENIVHRFLADGDDSWQLDLNPSTDYIHIVMSPFAPMSSQTVTYTLQVE